MAFPAPHVRHKPHKVNSGSLDVAAVKQAGATALPNGVAISGWRIVSCKSPIVGEAEYERYSAELGSPLTLPEILFGNSNLTLTHEGTGISLAFFALDALKAWKLEDLQPLKVSLASEWLRARQEEIDKQQALLLAFDWTYTTPYVATVIGHDGVSHVEHSLEAQRARAAAPATAAHIPVMAAAAPPLGTGPVSAAPAAAAVLQPLMVAAPDTVREGASGASPDDAPPPVLPPPQLLQQQEQAASGGPLHWAPTTEQIDRNMLMQREPILYYDEVRLYESELDDNGTCQLTAKVRVMAKCWLVLLRFYLRVDRTLVRLREVRYFCKLEGPDSGRSILREVKHVEGTFEELRAAGAPGEGPAYAEADSAGAALAAAAPVGLKLMTLHKAQLEP